MARSLGSIVRGRALILRQALVLVALMTAAPTVPAAPPTGFQNEILITGLNAPTAIAFTPDGRMFVAERAGRIHVVQPGATEVDPSPLQQLTNIRYTEGERGLVNIALDPAFGTNGFYYVFYTANAPLRDRVSRFTASGNATVPGSEVMIWEDNVDAGEYHHGGGLTFANGQLFIATGDHFNNASEAQSLSSYHGKLLRLLPDGTIPTGNPFDDGNGPNLDAIWALGLRNPFRVSFDSMLGRLHIADVGSHNRLSGSPDESIEELNIGVAGANYAWPICEGPCTTSGMTGPVFSYPQLGRDAAIMGGFVYRGIQFPVEYVGSYFYGDYTQNWIRRLTLDANGLPTANLPFEPASGALDGAYGEVVDLKEGPDGALYYVDIGIVFWGPVNSGTVRRIRYSVNQSPTALASANPTSGPQPRLSVTFSSAGSSDPEGQPLTYSWTFGDGGTSTAANPVHVYTASGSYTARVSVSDGITATLSTPLTITVGSPPTATILTPTGGTTFRAGDTISFSGVGTDPEAGALPAAAFSWTLLFLHDTHSHPYLGPLVNTANGSFTIAPTGHDYSGDTRYLITLTVTDPDGLTGTSSVTVSPETVNLTLTTVPSGLTLRIGGINRTAPVTLDSLVGFQHTIEAPNQIQGTTPYGFGAWSDGGAQAHTVVTPSTAQSYTATYQVAGAGTALRFNGTGTGDIDRVKIRIDAPQVPADVGATDFTIEWWMQATPGENTAGPITPGGVNWINGNILIDRDIFGPGDFGDYGVSLGAGRLAFGVGTSAGDHTIVGSTVVADGAWHHVAVTRRLSDGRLELYVDGALDASGDGPNGDSSYRNNRPSSWPNDPFLVIGAEKHDVVPPGTAYRGWVDELRLSTVRRYTVSFMRPSAPFVPDASTAALYHFDEGTGTVLGDSSGAAGGPSLGQLRVGGTPQGPAWVPSTAPIGTNQAPTVNAGPDQTITLPAGVTLDGTVTDDGLPAGASAVAVTWTLVSGPATVTIADPTAVDTSASFPGMFTIAGSYVFRLTANDGALSASDDVIVTALPGGGAAQSPMGDLAIDFGSPGLWGHYNHGSLAPQWGLIHGFNPSRLAAGDVDGNGVTDLIVEFGGSGLWIYLNHTTWTLLHTFDVTDIVVGDLDGNGQADVVVDFPGYGLWVWRNNATWAPLHPFSASGMATGNVDSDPAGRADLIVNFQGYGVFIWLNNAGWVQIHGANVTDIETGDLDGNGVADIVLDFPGAGIWVYLNNATWVLLHGMNGAGIAAGNLNGDAQGRAEVVINFPGLGVWAWVNNSTWVQLHGLNAPLLAVGDLDGNPRADLILYFPGAGIWVLRGYSSYLLLHSSVPDAIAFGRFDVN